MLITNVKGHATNDDITSGRVQATVEVVNDGADKLAVDAALRQSALTDLIRSAMKRKAQAMAVQRMIIAILEARAAVDTAVAEQLIEQGECDLLMVDSPTGAAELDAG